MKLIISDTTALITLSKTNNLHLLTNFVDRIYIPNAVMQELAFKDDEVKSLIQKSDFIEVKPLSKKIGQDLLDSNLDKGETEAIALALETNLSLIIDERSGRKFAEKKGVKIIGLLGILKANLARDHIAYTELLYILEEFKSVDFRLSKRLEEDFLKSLKLHQ